MANQDQKYWQQALQKAEETKLLVVDFRDGFAEEQLKNIHRFVRLETLIFRSNPQNMTDWKIIIELKNLTRLDFASGNLIEIPAFVFSLSQLETLQISHQQLKAIPDDIGQLKNLKRLDVYQNQIETISGEIGQLEKLQFLDLNANQLKNLPPELENLPSLAYLSLTANQFEAIPEVLAYMDVGQVNIGGNPVFSKLGSEERQIEKLFPELKKKAYPKNQRIVFFHLFLGSFSKITQNEKIHTIAEGLNSSFDLIRLNADVYLTKHFSSPFESKKLKKLNLYLAGKFPHFNMDELRNTLKNKGIAISEELHDKVSHVILGEYPKEKLQEAIQLKIPLVAQGDLQAFLKASEQEYYLQEDTEKSREMAERILQFLKSDEKSNHLLAFNFIKAGGIHPLFFYELLLSYLWNKDTDIRKLAGETLRKYLSQELFTHLKNNRRDLVKKPQEIWMTEYLKTLEHSELDFGKLLIAFQEKTGKCRQLCLQHEDSFEYIIQLEQKNSTLSLRNSKLEMLPSAIGNFQNLKVLYLYRNQLETLPNEFTNLKKLYILNLSKNKFKEFPEVLLENSNLRVLDLSENQISELPDNIDKLQKLERLDLSHNKLNKIPDSISKMENLRFLNIQKTTFVKDKNQILHLKKLLPKCRITIEQK